MGETVKSLAPPFLRGSGAGLSTRDSDRPGSVLPRARRASGHLPWGYIAAFVLGASAVAAATAYYTLQHQGAVTAIAIVQAGLLISMYGGLLESWRRMRALQQRMQRTQVVLKLREYAEDVLESMPSALVLLSPQRRVLFANSTFLTAFRLRRDEVVGRRLEEVNGAYELASALRQMLQGGALRDEVILETATNPAEENGGLRILLRELKSADESREARLLLIVEGVVKSEEASVPTLGPLRSLR